MKQFILFQEMYGDKYGGSNINIQWYLYVYNYGYVYVDTCCINTQELLIMLSDITMNNF